MVGARCRKRLSFVIKTEPRRGRNLQRNPGKNSSRTPNHEDLRRRSTDALPRVERAPPPSVLVPVRPPLRSRAARSPSVFSSAERPCCDRHHITSREATTRTHINSTQGAG